MKLILKSLCVAFVITALLTMLPFEARCNNISNEIFRLHILANSDSPEDQELKLKVRDALLEQTEALYQNAKSKQDAETLTAENIDEIIRIAEQTVYDCGYTYRVSAEITNTYFNTRRYGNITMPSGFYDALQIKIGSGSGHNWWCVMYPSLCIGAAASPDTLKKELSSDEMTIVTDESKFRLRFKILEYYETVKSWFS